MHSVDNPNDHIRRFQAFSNMHKKYLCYYSDVTGNHRHRNQQQKQQQQQRKANDDR